MKCANCDKNAIWVYDVPSQNTVAFCDADLPSFLRVQAKSGQLATTDEYAKVAAEVAEALAPPVVEPVVEVEPVADAGVTSAPKKRAAKVPAEEPAE